MPIDVKTLFLIVTVIGFLLSFWVCVMAWGKPRSDPLWAWAMSMLACSLGNVMISLRAVAPLLPTFMAGNVGYALTLAMMLLAVKRFQQAPVVHWQLVAPVVLAPLATWVFIDVSLSARVYAAVLVYGAQLILLLRALTDRKHPIHGRGRWILISTFALLLFTMLVRAVVVSMGWVEPVIVVGNSPIQGFVFSVLVASVLSMTLGFVYMTMERAERQSFELAMRDMLTGLANRRAITEDLEHVVARARRQGEQFSLLMLDIDHFKRVNDSLGHQAGDVVLREVAQLMRQRLRAQDHIGRFGGEEFLIVLPDTDLVGACTLAESLRTSVEAQPIHWGSHLIVVTVSIGVCASTVTVSETSDSFVAATDAALYRAKQSGRNRVSQ